MIASTITRYTSITRTLDPWPSPEQFRANIAWPGDRPILHEEARPTGAQGAAQGDGGRAEDDENMADLVDYFIGGD